MDSKIQLWNQSHPQTLKIAVALCYVNGVFGLLGGGALTLIGLILIVGWIGAAIGMANDKRIAYYIAVTLSLVALGFTLSVIVTAGSTLFQVMFFSMISLIFEIALVAALLHPMTREYQKVWFS
jgi:uncharacterized membrane protein